MSALRQLIATLWAAIWVRWRLLAVRARHLFDGRQSAVAGSGYYLAAAEIPVEGVDYELIDLPPELAARLDAARGELVEHARSAATRRVRRRRVRRRRTASLAMAALLTLAVLGAGATALVTGSTGVPAVDRLLGIYESELSKPGAAKRPGPTGRGVQPDPSIDGTSVEVQTSGKDRIASASYVAKDGRICTAITSTDASLAGGLTCVSPLRLAEPLARQGGILLSVRNPSVGVVLVGFVRANVGRVEGSGPRGGLDVQVGDVWTPGFEGLGSMRPFVGLAEPDPSRILDPHDYRMRAVTDDGDELQIAR